MTEENNVTNYDELEVLGVASWKGHLEIVRELIKAKANVNHKNLYGNTALMEVSGEGHLEIVKELLGAGALVNIKNSNNKN